MATYSAEQQPCACGCGFMAPMGTVIFQAHAWRLSERRRRLLGVPTASNREACDLNGPGGAGTELT